MRSFILTVAVLAAALQIALGFAPINPTTTAPKSATTTTSLKVPSSKLLTTTPFINKDAGESSKTALNYGLARYRGGYDYDDYYPSYRSYGGCKYGLVVIWNHIKICLVINISSLPYYFFSFLNLVRPISLWIWWLRRRLWWLRRRLWRLRRIWRVS